MSWPVLIQRAGRAVAQFCAAHFKFTTVCVICGRGRSGARGLAALDSFRQIAEGISLVLLAASPDDLEPDTAEFLLRLKHEPIWIASEGDFQAPEFQEALQADLIIDAIAGGSKPPLPPLYRKAVEAVNDAFGTIVSVDAPSGIDVDSTLPFHQSENHATFAHGIITFVAPTPAHVFGELTAGPIAVSELGVQPAFVFNATQLQVATGLEVGIAFPPRVPDSHKGKFGHVMVIAGSAGKSGAAVLAGMAALRTGAGLVTVACPRSIQAIVAGFAPEIMTEALPETQTGSIAGAAGEFVDKLIAGKDVVVLGPGLSQHQETVEFIRQLVGRCPVALVLDDAGISAFSGRPAELKNAVLPGVFRVLTPHPGDAALLLGLPASEVQSDRIKIAQRITAETSSCVVLKGWRTVIAGISGETWINMTGNAAMAKAGAGDVLSGIIGAALARQAATAELSNTTNTTPELEQPRTWAHELYGTDRRLKLRQLQTEQLERNIQKGAAFLKDVSVAAAVRLHGISGDLARDDLHENTVIARDLMENLSEGFHSCELEMERGLFYLQR